MLPIRGLFEAHLPVTDLQRAVAFYEQALGLELAAQFPERQVAFFWVGGPGKAMLGLWQSGFGPMKSTGHVAFTVAREDVLAAPERLRAAGIEMLDFRGEPAEEPSELPWMPAVAVYFRDPDGNLLEYLAMLDEAEGSSGARREMEQLGLR